MKKLVHETTDELTRSLLIAGIEHRPPAGNKAQLLVALGAGSAVGLFSAKAFGWFGTGAGKVTMVSMALGVAGAVYGVAPLLQAEADPASHTGEVTLAEGSEPAPTNAVVAPLMPPSPQPVKAPELVPEASAPTLPAESASASGSAEPAPADAVSASAKPRPSSRKARARAVRAEQNTGPLPAVEKTPPAVGALAEPEPEAEKTRERLRLDSEVELVDDMHWAARIKDHEALARLVEAYRLQFPDGQLQAEVAKFAARLERSSPR